MGRSALPARSGSLSTIFRVTQRTLLHKAPGIADAKSASARNKQLNQVPQFGSQFVHTTARAQDSIFMRQVQLNVRIAETRCP